MAVRITVYGTANMKQIEAARKELDKLEKQAKANSSGFATAMSKIGSATSNLGTKMSDVGKSMTKNVTLPLVALGAGLYKATQAAADDAQAQVRLATTLRNTAGATQEQIASTEEWVTAQGKLLGITDDQVRPALNSLVTATGDVTKAQQLAALSFDLATAKGVSVEAAASALAKAYAGNTMTLGRMLPGIDQATLKSGNLGKIFSEVNQIVGGQAAAAANTEAGARQRANVALQEAIEDLGTSFLPIMQQVTSIMTNDVIPAITQLTEWWKSLDGGTQQAIIKFGLFLAIAGPVMSALGGIVSGVGAVASGIGSVAGATTRAAGGLKNFYTGLTNANAGQSAFATKSMRVGGAIRNAALATKGFIVDLAKQGAALVVQAAKWVASTAAMIANKVATFAVSAASKAAAVAQWALNAAMSANPIGIVVLAIGALVAALVWLFNNNETVRNAFTSAWNTIKNAVASAFNWVKENWPLLLAILTGPIGLAVLAIVKNWDKIKAGASTAINAVISFFKGLPERILSALGNLGSLLLNAGKQLLEGLWNGLANTKDWIMDKIKGLGGSILDGIKSVFGIASPSKEFANIGDQLGAGLAKGIKRSTKTATDAAKTLGTKTSFATQNAIRKASAAMAAETRLYGVKFSNDPFSEFGGDLPKEKVETAAQKAAKRAKEIAKQIADRTNALMGSFGIGELVKAPETPVTAESLLAGAKSQATAMRNWVANLSQLRKSGLAAGALAALMAAGPQAAGAQAAAFASMTSAQLKEYNASYASENRYAGMAAKMESNKNFAPNVTIAPGAVTVTIQGNADEAATRAALDQALTKLVRELKSK